MLSTCKDKKIRIIDPRTSSVAQVGAREEYLVLFYRICVRYWMVKENAAVDSLLLNLSLIFTT